MITKQESTHKSVFNWILYIDVAPIGKIISVPVPPGVLSPVDLSV